MDVFLSIISAFYRPHDSVCPPQHVARHLLANTIITQAYLSEFLLSCYLLQGYSSFSQQASQGLWRIWGGRSPTFPFDSAGKESTWNAGDLRLIPAWVGMIPWKGKGYPLQYSGLGNSKECIVHGVTKSRTWLSKCHFSLKFILCRVFSSIVEDFSGHLVFHITRNGSHHICDILFVFS